MKRIVMLIAAVMCLHLTAPSLFAQHLEIEESISQHNIPKRTIESPAESSAGTSYIPKGYRGMVEMAYGAGIAGGNFLSQISTTHGWQFNQYLYLGGFASFGSTETLFHYVESHYTEPIHTIMDFRFGADFRAYISMRRVSPYVGLKLGYDIGESSFHRTINLSGQLGGRFAIKGRHALNFALQAGLTALHLESEVLFKLGYEF